MTISDSSPGSRPGSRPGSSQRKVDDRRYFRRGAAILFALMAIAGLASCGEASAGVVPTDADRGVLASSPAANAGGGVAAGDETQPPEPAQAAQAAPLADPSSGDIYVTGKTNLGGHASVAFESKIRNAVADYVSSRLPGTTLVGVRVTTEQSKFAPAVVTLAGAGGTRTVTMTLTEQATGWVVVAVTTLPGGIG